MFGNMYHNVVNIDNGSSYFVLFMGFTVTSNLEINVTLNNENFRTFVNVLELLFDS